MACNEYILIYSGMDKCQRAKEGVAIFIKGKYKNQIQSCKYVSERFLVLSMDMDHVQIHASEDCKTLVDREKFYVEPHQVIDSNPVTERIIILFNFN